jgi:hypothetical protein
MTIPVEKKLQTTINKAIKEIMEYGKDLYTNGELETEIDSVKAQKILAILIADTMAAISEGDIGDIAKKIKK